MPVLPTWLVDTAVQLRRELSRLRLDDARAALCAQTVAAVLLAYGLSEWLQLRDRWWVALSAFVVVRAEIALTRKRGIERLAGTLAGALLGAGVGAAVALLPRDSAWLYPSTLALIAGGGLYLALESRHSYFWVLATVTAVMVLSDLRLHDDLVAVALSRIADVGVGVGSAIAVTTLAVWARQLWPSPSAATAHTAAGDGRDGAAARRSLRLVLAACCALVVGALGSVYHAYPFGDLSQALVSVIAVLMVPLAVDSDATPGTHARIGLKMLRRVLGCLSAALLALLLLPLLGGHPLLCLLALAVGVWIAAHLQAGPEATAYLGTQFGVGFIMVFVQDHSGIVSVSAPLHRLLGIILGLLGLAVPMLLMMRMQRRRARA